MRAEGPKRAALAASSEPRPRADALVVLVCGLSESTSRWTRLLRNSTLETLGRKNVNAARMTSIQRPSPVLVQSALLNNVKLTSYAQRLPSLLHGSLLSSNSVTHLMKWVDLDVYIFRFLIFKMGRAETDMTRLCGLDIIKGEGISNYS